jgi:hypothetical protein
VQAEAGQLGVDARPLPQEELADRGPRALGQLGRGRGGCHGNEYNDIERRSQPTFDFSNCLM